MGKAAKRRIALCVLMLFTAVCVPAGESGKNSAGSLSPGYRYPDGLLPSGGTAFRG